MSYSGSSAPENQASAQGTVFKGRTGFFPRPIHEFCGYPSSDALVSAEGLVALMEIKFAAFEVQPLPGSNGKNLGIKFRGEESKALAATIAIAADEVQGRRVGLGLEAVAHALAS
jgi:hypothetical protein